MQTDFTPVASLAGGVLIGVAAVALMLVHGRIAGATGILSGFILPESKREWIWRAAMIAGMMAAPVAAVWIAGRETTIQVPVSTFALIVGGVIVGFGASLGNGCTSGHGVCGMARLSRRSVVATAIFMTASAVTVYVARHLIGG